MTTESPTPTRIRVTKEVAGEHIVTARAYLHTYSPSCLSHRSVDVLALLLDAAYLTGQASKGNGQSAPPPSVPDEVPQEMFNAAAVALRARHQRHPCSEDVAWLARVLSGSWADGYAEAIKDAIVANVAPHFAPNGDFAIGMAVATAEEPVDVHDRETQPPTPVGGEV